MSETQEFCDGKGCGDARVVAKVYVLLKNGGELTFCNHHFNRFRAGLDDREAIYDWPLEDGKDET